MNLRAIERRLTEIEARTGGDPEAEARSIQELWPGLVSLWIEGACAVLLGGEGDPHGEGDPLRVEVEAHPRFEAEVNRRIPALSAWITWHRVHRAHVAIAQRSGPGGIWEPVFEVLRPRDLGNWAWACAAVRVLRRDGGSSPEAVELLRAGEEAGVGEDHEEKARVTELALAILADVGQA